jgi:hypothetical protein
MIPGCDDESLSAYTQASALEPRFPFGHYALALCLLQKGDPTWRHQAEAAVEILRITTTIAGHHVNHDQTLQFLLQLLANPQYQGKGTL